MVVAVRIRAGDFPKAERWNYSNGVMSRVQRPVSCYIAYLRQLAADTANMQRLKRWQDEDCLHSPPPINASPPLTVFLATEDASKAVPLRNASIRTISLQHAVQMTSGLGRWTQLSGVVGNHSADWLLLSRVRVLLASHSLYSLTAALQSLYYEPRTALIAKPDPAHGVDPAVRPVERHVRPRSVHDRRQAAISA